MPRCARSNLPILTHLHPSFGHEQAIRVYQASLLLPSVISPSYRASQWVRGVQGPPPMTCRLCKPLSVHFLPKPYSSGIESRNKQKEHERKQRPKSRTSQTKAEYLQIISQTRQTKAKSPQKESPKPTFCSFSAFWPPIEQKYAA